MEEDATGSSTEKFTLTGPHEAHQDGEVRADDDCVPPE
jgi:hypothetical protein